MKLFWVFGGFLIFVFTTIGGQDLQTMTGEELVKELLDDKVILDAYHELLKRNGLEEWEVGKYRMPEVTVCPQNGGKHPIYVVLSQFLDPEVYDGLSQTKGKFEKRDHLKIDAFTAKGKRIDPWGGDNVLDGGIIADFNGDGLVELAGKMSYGLHGVLNINVLEISVVREKAVPIFAVLYNFGEDDSWGYVFVDRDKDGLIEIEFGPKTANFITSKVVYRWDKKRKAYVGPEGKDNDHFRIIDATRLWMEFKRLKAEGVNFVKDSESLKELLIKEERIEARFAKMHPERHEREIQKAAMKDITVISTALADYLTDNGVIPAQDGIYSAASGFYSSLSPFYVKILPIKDAWGNNYRVYCGKACNGKYGITGCNSDDFIIVSYGRDGQKEDWIFDSSNPNVGLIMVKTEDDLDLDIDLVMWNGSWIRCPRIEKD